MYLDEYLGTSDPHSNDEPIMRKIAEGSLMRVFFVFLHALSHTLSS